jgi:hypothetical protein
LVATVRPDGSVTFKALTRSISTSVDAIYRIGIAGTRGRSYVYYFGTRSASLQDFGGGSLTRYLFDRNPSIEDPHNLQRRREFRAR